MKYLLDTNVCLDFLLRRSERVIAKVDEMYGRLTVSAITVAELRVGAKTSTDPADDDRIIDQFLASFDVAPFDDVSASAYGHIVRHLNVRRGSFDRLIAAHALSLGATLITNNTRDFADVPGLRIENWTQ